MMNRTPFVRLPEESSVSPRKNDLQQDTSSMGNSHGSQGLIHDPPGNPLSGNPSASSGYPSVLTAGSRFRGQKEVDINKWDEEASHHLLTMKRPPGDLCDCMRPWRRFCRLRYPPPSQKMAENVENGFRLPFGVIWFVRDCAGCVCMVFTWLLIFYGEFVVVCIILPQLPSVAIAWIFGILFHIFAFLATFSHLKTVFTDPGAVRLGNATRDAVMRIYLASGSNTPLIRCPKCLCIKPERAHHCSCCRRCIRKMDHHCPWVNNCVGEGNQKFFVLFNLYIFLLAIVGTILTISFFLFCFSEFGMCEYPGSYSATASLICNIFLVSESIFFGLFTSIMSCSQVSAIISDETAVESIKRDKGSARPRLSKRESLANVFGRPFSWRWFSPFHPPAPMTPVIPPPTTTLPAKDGESSTDGTDMEMHYHYNHQAAGGHEQQYNDIYLV
ncbi:unnamed protein product [Hymenolepis diminuta]|uniref:Palmitoyltransferase n=1 Tax=Hymenolepis diminuta TaxID=6216 RepID=A0A564YT07_HYMDI|nr:unnamed protein product [Hymenolepis diminuta]